MSFSSPFRSLHAPHPNPNPISQQKASSTRPPTCSTISTYSQSQSLFLSHQSPTWNAASSHLLNVPSSTSYMTRPKRAAAIRAASTFVGKQDQSPAVTPEGTPVRSLRRATFRSSRHGARDLKRRRADFERVVKFHQIHLRDMKENQTLDNSLTDDSLELSQDSVALTSQWAHEILEEPLDPLRSSLRSLSLRLQATCNLTEAADDNSTSELVGKPPSDDEDVRGLSEALLTERFMSHEGEHVKLLVACCLAELLRICAPDPPIPERKLNQVCALFIEQLAVLSAKDDPAEPYRFSLLEQLATVKAFVIFSDDDEVICDIFACFYAVVKQHQSDKVKQYFADILISLLEEADNLSTAALDAMLAPFVSVYGYSEDAVALAARVLHGASSFIHVPLSSLLNASIRDLRSDHRYNSPRKVGHGRRSPAKLKFSSASGVSAKEHSEHHEHLEDLIVAVNRVVPDVLVYVIPNLEDGLTSKDAARRIAASALLGRLFVSRADVANAYPSLFAEFLNRGRDESADVRGVVTATLGRLMKLHPKHREFIDLLLRSRIFDRSEAVRIAAVQSVGRAGDGTSDELLKMHASRLRDKKQSIRHITADAVSELYTSNVQPPPAGTIQLDIAENLTHTNAVNRTQELKLQKRGGSDTQEETHLLEELESRTLRLSWLPDTLLDSVVAVDAVGDHETARRVEKIILSDIPALVSKKSARIKYGLRQLCVFLAHLSDAAYLTLSGRLRDKWRARSKLQAIAEYRLRSKRCSQREDNVMLEDAGSTPRSPANRSGPKGGQARLDNGNSPEELRRLAASLATCLRRRYAGAGDMVAMCTSLAEVPDLKCFESIERSIDCRATFEQHIKERQEALRSAGVRASAHSFWSEVVLPDCFPGVLSAHYFTLATEIAVEESKDRDEETSADSEERSQSILRGVFRFLEFFGTYAKEVLDHVVDDIRTLCAIQVDGSIARAEVLLCGLRLASHVSGQSYRRLADEGFRNTLRSLMICSRLISPERGAALAKAAARAIMSFQNDSGISESLSDLVKSLVFELDSFSGHVESIVAPLAALSQFAKYAPQLFKDMSLGCFDFSRGLLSGSLNAKIEAACKEEHSSDYNSERSTQETLMPVFGAHTKPLSDAIRVREHLLRATLVQQATKLFVYSLTYLEDEELSGVVKVLLQVAFEKRGKILASTDGSNSDDEDYSDTEARETSSSKAMSAACRLFAGRGIIYLARQSKFFRGISPSVLCSTVLLLQDENSCVRMCFAAKICNSIIKKRLPLRWVVGLALMAVDPDRNNIVHVKALLSSVFRYRRRVYEVAKRASEKTSVLLLPEVTVAELIWVLGNLPDVEMDEATGFQESEKCLQLYLDRLLETNEHAGILHEYIESLSIAQDVTEDEENGPGPRTQRMTELGQIAAAILKKKQAGKKWNLTEHPGQVSLPKDMFRLINRKTETSGVRPVSLVQVARRFDEGVQTESAKKMPGDSVRQAKASPIGKKTKRSSPSNDEASNGTPGSTSQTRSAEKRGSSELAGSNSRLKESPPKRPRVSRGRKRLSDELRKQTEDPCVRDSPLTGQGMKVAVTDDTKENQNGVGEGGSKQSTAASSGRKEQAKKRSRSAPRPAAGCTTEAKTKLSRIRRSARNRGP